MDKALQCLDSSIIVDWDSANPLTIERDEVMTRNPIKDIFMEILAHWILKGS